MKHRLYGRHLGTQMQRFYEAVRINGMSLSYLEAASRRLRTDSQIIFGRWLRSLRMLGQQPMTMGELARSLGVLVSYVSDVERGYRKYTASELQQFATLVGADANQLAKMQEEANRT